MAPASFPCSRPRRARGGLLAILLLLVAACGEGDAGGSGVREGGDRPEADPAEAPAPGGEVRLVFSRGDSAHGVARSVEMDDPGPEDALRLLLAGPSPAERRDGVHSWFSGATAGALRSVTLRPDSVLVVDFHDLRPLIPNASASTGSAMLLRELNGTLLAFPEVAAIEYRMEGSCDIFWNWLQYDCRIVRRP